MKRWIIYAAVIAVLGFSPHRGVDISKLTPVQTVWLTEQNGVIYLHTDSGDFGAGADIEAALNTLNDSASGIVFLETADYLIIEVGREELLMQVNEIFRPGCMICTAEERPDLKKATAYLEIHAPDITLRQWRVEQKKLQQLQEKDGRLGWSDG